MTSSTGRVSLFLLAAIMLTAIPGCDSEPTLHDDFATYQPSDPVPFSPIPGADVESWVAAIDELEIGEWSSSGGLMPDDYEPRGLEPIEDSRIEDERLSWALEATVPNDTVDFTFTARAVTDADGGVLTMYCAAVYDASASDHDGDATSALLEGVRKVLEGCVSRFSCDAIGSAELVDWFNTQMTAADAAYADPENSGFLVEEGLNPEDVQVWFNSSQRSTAVSINLDPRSPGVAS